MKYEKEIDQFIQEYLPKESWMSDEDYDEFLELVFEAAGTSTQGLSDAIEIGVANGYSVEHQMEIFKSLI